jgi:hypothetical protein
MRIVYDVKKRKVGCVLMQASLGGTVPNELFNKFFPSETWEVEDVRGMALYPVSEDQLEQLSKMSKRILKMSKRTRKG